MTSFKLLVDGVETGLSIMAENASEAASTAYDNYWLDHLSKFKQYGKIGTITAVGPVRFPDGWRDVAHF